MFYDYFLTADTLDAIIEDIRGAGFKYTKEVTLSDGTTKTVERYPKTGEITSQRGGPACIYLGHIVETPAVIDQDGNVVQEAVFSTKFHANVRMLSPHTFATAMSPEPSTPVNRFG